MTNRPYNPFGTPWSWLALASANLIVSLVAILLGHRELASCLTYAALGLVLGTVSIALLNCFSRRS